MKKYILLLLVLLLLCACTSPAQETPPSPTPEPAAPASTAPEPSPAPEPEPTPTPLGTEGGAYASRFDDAVTGDYLDYRLIVPENPVEGMPLLVFLHGDGNRALPESLENNPISLAVEEIYGSQAPFLLLMPNTRLWSWTAGSIPETLIHLIENVAEEYAVDAERIMLAGHSRGAIGTWYYLSRCPELFSAAVPISCGCDEALDYEAMSAVPVWGFCGDVGRDGSHYLPAMETIAANINSAGGSAKIDVLTGCDHAAAERAAWTKEVFEWLLSQ